MNYTDFLTYSCKKTQQYKWVDKIYFHSLMLQPKITGCFCNNPGDVVWNTAGPHEELPMSTGKAVERACTVPEHSLITSLRQSTGFNYLCDSWRVFTCPIQAGVLQLPVTKEHHLRKNDVGKNHTVQCRLCSDHIFEIQQTTAWYAQDNKECC